MLYSTGLEAIGVNLIVLILLFKIKRIPQCYYGNHCSINILSYKINQCCVLSNLMFIKLISNYFVKYYSLLSVPNDISMGQRPVFVGNGQAPSPLH